MAKHNITGSWGEKLAREALIVKGYAITECNHRVGNYEIDIIAMKGNRIIFVEVKTRSNGYVDPLEAIDRKKMQHMARAADAYIRNNSIRHEAQFDVITIVGTPDQYTLEHIPDAFMPPLKNYR